jgi:hypothetical protein
MLSKINGYYYNTCVWIHNGTKYTEEFNLSGDVLGTINNTVYLIKCNYAYNTNTTSKIKGDYLPKICTTGTNVGYVILLDTGTTNMISYVAEGGWSGDFYKIMSSNNYFKNDTVDQVIVGPKTKVVLYLHIDYLGTSYSSSNTSSTATTVINMDNTGIGKNQLSSLKVTTI